METPPLGGLEKLDKSLYSKNAAQKPVSPHDLTEKEYGIKKDWGESDDMPKQNMKVKSFWHKFFTFSVVFFIFALALSAFIFWRGGNVISSDNVDIVINGPVGVSAGEEMSFQVSVLNRNNVDLEGAVLIIEYPSGTVNPQNPQEVLPRYREELGKLSSGDRIQKVMKAIVFGEENEKKTVNVVVEYRVEGSNAIFFKEKPYEFIISSAPMSLLVTGPETTSSGSEIELVIVAASNSEKPITNTAISIDYPFGFIFKESEPPASSGNNFWILGTLDSREQEKVVVRGVMEGQNEEERVFRIEAGTGDRSRVSTLFTSFLHSIAIKKPALGLEMAVSGNANSTVTAFPGDTIRGDLEWQNNLQNQVRDVFASAKITTSGFDPGAVSVPTGFFRSGDGTVVWTKDRNKALALINPGEKGILSFSFKIPSLAELAGPGGVFENPNIRLESSISGKDMAVSGSEGNRSNSDQTLIKISSPVSFVTAVSKDDEKTYTVKITVKNPFNELGGVKLSASLPTYVKWTSSYMPSNETVSYNSLGGGLLWNVGKLPAGVGYSRNAREISFKFEIDESLIDTFSNQTLLKDVKISGEDQYTGKKVEFGISSVNLTQ